MPIRACAQVFLNEISASNGGAVLSPGGSSPDYIELYNTTAAAVSLAGGELPLWNPYTFNGMPFQADIQSAIFYIPNLLLTLFSGGGHLDYWWVELSIIAHFALAGSGMYLLARGFGIGRWYAVFSGIAYCFSGFMVGQLIHQGFIYQAAWFPLVFLAFRNALHHRCVWLPDVPDAGIGVNAQRIDLGSKKSQLIS